MMPHELRDSELCVRCSGALTDDEMRRASAHAYRPRECDACWSERVLVVPGVRVRDTDRPGAP